MDHSLFIDWDNWRAGNDDIYSWADYFDSYADDEDTWNDLVSLYWL